MQILSSADSNRERIKLPKNAEHAAIRPDKNHLQLGRKKLGFMGPFIRLSSWNVD